MRQITLLIALLSACSASAGIGQPESAVDADTIVLRGTQHVLQKDSYRVHEIKTDAQLIREYVSADGVVFAVSWRGGGSPDLDQLFGNYTAEYRAAELRVPPPTGRLPKVVQSDHLVVLRFGQMRNVFGRAYVPGLLPRGFDVKELQ